MAAAYIDPSDNRPHNIAFLRGSRVKTTKIISAIRKVNMGRRIHAARFSRHFTNDVN